uniref:Uncharacterized protein n=1 Tax=Arundo donax TaxID=35708 RepID=A0A0A8Y9G3_ARUDO
MFKSHQVLYLLPSFLSDFQRNKNVMSFLLRRSCKRAEQTVIDDLIKPYRLNN